MGLTSEQVHWIFGAVLVVAAVLLLLRALNALDSRWVDYVVPGALTLFGIELALDPLIHGAAAPTDYGAEMMQHFVLSALLLVSAAIEFVRVARRQRALPWRLPFAFALLLTGGVLALHAQHDMAGMIGQDMASAMLMLMTQHRMMAATLVAAGLAVLLEAPDKPGDRPRPLALPLLVLVLGVQFLVYTEGSTLFGGSGGGMAH